jgi:hypothetical protein
MCQFELNIDVADDVVSVPDTFCSIWDFNLTVTRFEFHGPAGGNPNFTIRGAKTSILNWLRDIYLDGNDAGVDLVKMYPLTPV